MTRLLVHVEGQTEEQFIKGVLRDYLVRKGYHAVDARILGRKKSGICSWDSARKEILNHLKKDAGCLISTMVDFYRMPATGGRAWPGRAEEARLNGAAQKAACVQSAMHADVAAAIGDARRFVPFVVMHEFEGLLFSDCLAFARAILRENLASGRQGIRDGFETPEDINDSEQTAPSKRVLKLMPEYQKPRQGEDAAREIGIERMRLECPLFDAWIRRLEDLAAYAPAAW